ncbi:helix-turn-helix transcriptional regulator [Streptomyces sp. ST2-7A]|uniref:helix-turn-helix domain-containing protein n=1 Tax=Streptomyces sp. ST2-7A TaxID=2907214 RepID=UPI001F30DB15|nr:helix-turn-helix transcriptional regulator [Streptomyces sp. ST2-7A]MCE7083368.1 helix-turn-helix domain-containing protein [Streptomyces sp. ST2-7A]
MGLRTHISQRQRRLGQELRRLREGTGLSGAEAGGHIGLGRAHLSHIEAGRTHIPESKLRTLLKVYGCENDEYVHALLSLNITPKAGWWRDHRELRGSRLYDLAELEDSAVSFRTFQWLYIPGLLQTPEYMRALFRKEHPEAGERDLEQYVNFRLHRQEVLTRDPLPCYHAVIHEAALRMQFVDAGVMRRQLDHLTALSAQPNITIQLAPFAAAISPSTPGAPFTLFESHSPTLPTVHVEHPTTSVFLSDPAHISRFTDVFTRLGSASLPPLKNSDTLADGSLGLIQHIAYLLRGGTHG